MSAIDIERVPSGHDSLPVCLWKENPHRLVSLWNMLAFWAKDFIWAVGWIEEMKREAKLGKPISPARSAEVADQLKVLDSHLRGLGLESSVAQLERIAFDIQHKGPMPLPEFGNLITALRHRIDDDLRARMFYCVPSELTSQFFYFVNPYDQFRSLEPRPLKDVFGAKVMATFFKSDDHDPKEAMFCLVHDRNTASVFHLMRMLEIGLTPLCAVFSVSMAHTNWGPVLEELDSRIKNMHKDSMWKSLPDCKDRQERYAQAASHFDTLRLAWRNYTAHVRGKYTDTEAQDIFRNVKGFLQKVADLIERYPVKQ